MGFHHSLKEWGTGSPAQILERFFQEPCRVRAANFLPIVVYGAEGVGLDLEAGPCRVALDPDHADGVFSKAEIGIRDGAVFNYTLRNADLLSGLAEKPTMTTNEAIALATTTVQRAGRIALPPPARSTF